MAFHFPSSVVANSLCAAVQVSVFLATL